MDRITSTLTKETFFAALEKLPKEKVTVETPVGIADGEKFLKKIK